MSYSLGDNVFETFSRENVSRFGNIRTFSDTTTTIHRGDWISDDVDDVSVPKGIDANWLRTREDRLLNQSDVVTQRLADLNKSEDEQMHTYTAYHGITAPKRKLIASQAVLIKMRKAQQQEAIFRHHRDHAILRYLEAWRIKTIKRCHYLACKKRAKRYRLQKAMSSVLNRCVFTCKFWHSISISMHFYQASRCRKAIGRLKIATDMARKYSLMRSANSAQVLAWQKWKARFFAILDIRYHHMTCTLRAYRFRLRKCAGPFIRYLYNNMMHRQTQRKVVGMALRRNKKSARSDHAVRADSVRDLIVSHVLNRGLYKLTTYYHHICQQHYMMSKAYRHRISSFIKKWRARCLLMKRPKTRAATGYSLRAIESAFSQWRRWKTTIQMEKGPLRLRSMHRQVIKYKTALLDRYMERLLRVCAELKSRSRLWRMGAQHHRKHSLRMALRKIRLFLKVNVTKSRSAGKMVERSRFGNIALSVVAIRQWSTCIMVRKELRLSLQIALRYDVHVSKTSGWVLWMQYRQKLAEQRGEYAFGRRQFGQWAGHRLFRGYRNWKDAIEHLRGMENIGYYQWRNRACENVFATMALRVLAAKKPDLSNKKLTEHAYRGSYSTAPGVMLADRHFLVTNAEVVFIQLRQRIHTKQRKKNVNSTTTCFHNKYIATAALRKMMAFVNKAIDMYKMEKACAHVRCYRRFRHGLEALRNLIQIRPIERKNLKASATSHQRSVCSSAVSDWIENCHTAVILKRYTMKASTYHTNMLQNMSLRKWRYIVKCRQISRGRFHGFYMSRKMRSVYRKLGRSLTTHKGIVRVLMPMNIAFTRDTHNPQRVSYWVATSNQYLFTYYASHMRAFLWRRFSRWCSRRKQLQMNFNSMSIVRNMKIKRRVFAALLWNSVDETEDNAVLTLGSVYYSAKMYRKYFEELVRYRRYRRSMRRQNSRVLIRMSNSVTQRVFQTWRVQLGHKHEVQRQHDHVVAVAWKKKYMRKLFFNVETRKLHQSEEENYSSAHSHVSSRKMLKTWAMYAEGRQDRQEVMQAANNYFLRLYLLRLVYKLNLKIMFTKMRKNWKCHREYFMKRRVLVIWKNFLGSDKDYSMALLRKVHNICRGVKVQRKRQYLARNFFESRSITHAWRLLSIVCVSRAYCKKGKQHHTERMQRIGLRILDRAVYNRKQRKRSFEGFLAKSKQVIAPSKKKLAIRWLRSNVRLCQQCKAVSHLMLRRYFKFFEAFRNGRRLTRLALTNLTSRSAMRMRKVFDTWKTDTVVERILDTALWRKTCYQKYVVISHWKQLITWKREDRNYKTHMIRTFMQKQDVLFMKAFFRRLRRLIRYRKSNHRMEKRSAKALMFYLFQCTAHLRSLRKKQSVAERKASTYYLKSMLSLGFRYLLFKVTSKRWTRRILQHNDRRHQKTLMRSGLQCLWFNDVQSRKLRVLHRRLHAYVDRRKKLVALQILDGRVCSKWAFIESMRLLDIKRRKMALIRGMKRLVLHARQQHYRRRRHTFHAEI